MLRPNAGGCHHLHANGYDYFHQKEHDKHTRIYYSNRLVEVCSEFDLLDLQGLLGFLVDNRLAPDDASRDILQVTVQEWLRVFRALELARRLRHVLVRLQSWSRTQAIHGWQIQRPGQRHRQY